MTILYTIIICLIVYIIYCKTYKTKNPYDNTDAPITVANRLIPLYPKDFAWSIFIYKNLDKLYPIESYYTWGLDEKYPTYFKIKGYDNYVISFMYTWMWHIYEGKTAEGIRNNFDLGGTSIKADYISVPELKVGNAIQKWYINHLRTNGWSIELNDSGREIITKIESITI